MWNLPLARRDLAELVYAICLLLGGMESGQSGMVDYRDVPVTTRPIQPLYGPGFKARSMSTGLEGEVTG
jgi:hypothetical protein